MSSFITGVHLKSIWASYDIESGFDEMTGGPCGPYILYKDTVQDGKFATLISEHKTEEEATAAFWDRIAADVATMVAEVIINGGPRA